MRYRTFSAPPSLVAGGAVTEGRRREAGSPPASPGAVRRARDHDVFLRLAGAAAADCAPPRGVVKEMAHKRSMGVGSVGDVWLQCTHVAEGHAGAVLALAVTSCALYSGGVDRTVRAWDLAAGAEAWRGAVGGAAGALAASNRFVFAAAGAAVRIYDTRTHSPVATLWSSGACGAAAPARGVAGETAVTALVADDAALLYTAAGDKLRLWDLRTMKSSGSLWSGHAAAVMCLALGGAPAPLLCSGSKDHYVRTVTLQPDKGWEGGAVTRRQLQPPHYDGVQALALTGNVLYSASRDSSLKRWSLPDGALTHGVMNAHKGWATGVVSLGTTGAGWVASCGRDGALRLWSGTLRPAAAAPLPDAAHALAAHPDPALAALYTAGNGGDIRAWRVVAEA